MGRFGHLSSGALVFGFFGGSCMLNHRVFHKFINFAFFHIPRFVRDPPRSFVAFYCSPDKIVGEIFVFGEAKLVVDF